MNKGISMKKNQQAILFLAGITLFLFVSSCKSNDNSNQKPLFDYRETELDNGMKVITLEDFSCPIVSVQVWYHTGSKNEDPERQGFAHMFEHMMFKGTDRVGPRDHFDFIRSVGGTNNGYTSFDKTVYLETLPVNQLELALWLEAERMTFLKIDQDAFTTERQVVEEELRMRRNRPYGTLQKKLAAKLFKEHPYRWLPIGDLKHLRAASVAELRDFWTKHYVPNNATLIIVGAVEHAKAQALAKRYFGWIPKWGEAKEVTVREPRQMAAETMVIDDENAPAPVAGIAWRTVPLGHEDEVVLDLLSEILGGGNSSRLYRELVAEKQVAVNTLATTFNLQHDGLFVAGALQAPGAESDIILELIKKHISKIKSEGVSEQELEKARNQMLKSVVTGNLTIDRKARLLGMAAVEKQDISRVNTMFDEIRAVKRADIQRAAKTYLTDKGSLTVIVKENLKGALAGERLEEEAPITAEAEEKAPPPGRKGVVRGEDFPTKAPFGELVDFNPMPKYSVKELANGLTVMVVENNEVPFVSVTLGLLSGAWTEKKPGTASMAMQMLTKGTGKHTEAALAEELERYAISLYGSANMDTSAISANCVSEHIGRAMSLLGEVVLEPAFWVDEFEKLQIQVVTSLVVEAQRPSYQADKEFRRRLYGEHPYARTVRGELEEVKRLKVDDLKSWWRKSARPDKATLIFAGDITEAEAVKLANKTLGRWKAEGKEKQVSPADFPKADGMRIYVVNRPGSQQSQIRMGLLGITRHQQPDYFVSRVVSNYFGWGFNSRLNESIRVKQGLTYGIWGGFNAQQMAGSIEIGTFTKTEKTAEMLRAILEEIKLLQEKGPSEKELSSSKNYIAGSFVRNRETPQQVARDLWLIESQKLGSDYLQKLLSQVAETSEKDCMSLVTKTVDTDKLVIVIVADAEKVVDELEKIAPVEIVEIEAN